MSRPATLRAADREVHVFRRLWRGSVSFSLVQPLLFLAAMGLGLGDLVDQNQGDVDGVPYLTSSRPVSWRPAPCWSAAPRRCGRSWVASSGSGPTRPWWPHRSRPAMPSAAGCSGSRLRTAIAAAAFLLVAAVLGAVPSAWGILAVPAAVLCAHRLCRTDRRLHRHAGDRPQVPDHGAPRADPAVPVLGDVLPCRRAAWRAAAARVALAALARHRARAAARRRATSAFGSAVVHVAVLAALVVAGAQAGERTFTRRLTP